MEASQKRVQLLLAQRETAELRSNLEVKSQFIAIARAEKERCQLVADLARQLEQHFPNIQAKYTQLELHDDRAVSLKYVPFLNDPKTKNRRIRLVIFVPETREVYLKFGIRHWHDTWYDEGTVNTKDYLEAPLVPLPANKAFSGFGPFEYRLPAGVSRLDWMSYVDERRQPRFELYLSDELLLKTRVLPATLKTDGVAATLVRAGAQVDFPPNRVLQSLVVLRLQGDFFPEMFSKEEEYFVHVWIDGKSDDLPSFPSRGPRTQP
jgi:hypothetical protein